LRLGIRRGKRDRQSKRGRLFLPSLEGRGFCSIKPMTAFHPYRPQATHYEHRHLDVIGILWGRACVH
jgi:hypothetical protein